MTHAGPAIAIGVIDVGSPTKDKLGWAILGPDEVPRLGKDLDDFITEMADLADRWPLAIGFEAPLFIPTRTAALMILTGRKGEGSRPWSAGAGASVTTAALGVVTYTLAGLRRRLTVQPLRPTSAIPPPVQATPCSLRRSSPALPKAAITPTTP